MEFSSGRSLIIESLSVSRTYGVIAHHVLDEFDHLIHAKLPTLAKSPPELGRSHLALFLVSNPYIRGKKVLLFTGSNLKLSVATGHVFLIHIGRMDYCQSCAQDTWLLFTLLRGTWSWVGDFVTAYTLPRLSGCWPRIGVLVCTAWRFERALRMESEPRLLRHALSLT
jgi:hypothetical protein